MEQIEPCTKWVCPIDTKRSKRFHFMNPLMFINFDIYWTAILKNQDIYILGQNRIHRSTHDHLLSVNLENKYRQCPRKNQMTQKQSWTHVHIYTYIVKINYATLA